MLRFRTRTTWFDAITECRQEGGGSELLSFESLTERNWILQIALRHTYATFLINDSIWLVNAHKYLYNSEFPAWANGQPLGMTARRTAASIICNAWGTRRHVVEKACFGLLTQSSDQPVLVDLNCAIAYTYRAICKRPT